MKMSNMIWMMLMSTCLIILNLEATLGEPQVPCYFIFGDSLFDGGNNNKLSTTLKTNYPPYGIDFPGGVATGRFTNGRTIVDIIAEYLGFEDYIPAFTTAEGQEIMNGVNYASGGAGIRNETGSHLGDRICMNRQLVNHQTTISDIASLLGNNKTAADDLLNKCLYVVGAGNNDYMNNYFLPEYYKTSKIYTPEKYAKILKQQYSQQLMDLYKFGARKITIFGLSPSGCTPAMRKMYSEKLPKCVDSVNRAIELFNEKLKSLVDELNAKLDGAKFTYINIYSIQFGDIFSRGNWIPYQPCCKVSEKNKGQCIPKRQPCHLRSLHYFFDNYHPTEAVNTLTATRAYRAAISTDVYPMDISELIKL